MLKQCLEVLPVIPTKEPKKDHAWSEEPNELHKMLKPYLTAFIHLNVILI